MTIKDIIASSGFGFKGVERHSLSVWFLIPLLFPLFPPCFLYDRKKLSQLCQDGVYSRLQGVMCAYLRL